MNSLRGHLLNGNRVREQFVDLNADAIRQAETVLTNAVKEKAFIFACGNGGSASDAAHFVAELTGRYKTHRPGYPAMALTCNTPELTAVSNDFGYKESFSRIFRAIAMPKSLLIALSTSGNSPNMVDVVAWALHLKHPVINLLGGKYRGGTMSTLPGAINLIVPSDDTALVQECHIGILHHFASIVDYEFH